MNITLKGRMEEVDGVSITTFTSNCGFNFGNTANTPKGLGVFLGKSNHNLIFDVSDRLYAVNDKKISDEKIQKIGGCAKNLYRNMQFTDVVFSVENKTFKAHRAVLVLQSEFFNLLFTTPMKGHEVNGALVMKDIDAVTFEKILRFCYLKDINVNPETFFRLAQAADMYMMNLLKHGCVFAFDEVFDNPKHFIAKLDQLKTLPYLKNKCLDLISKKWSQLVEHDLFFEVVGGDIPFLKKILKNIAAPQRLRDADELYSHLVRESAGKSDKFVSEMERIARAGKLLDSDILDLCIEYNVKLPMWFANKYMKKCNK